jgi:CRP-like cAMP-binding protein
VSPEEAGKRRSRPSRAESIKTAPPDPLVERELFIRSFFPTKPPERVTNQLVATMRDVDFPAGAVIFRAGDPPDQLFFISSGSVRLEAEGEKPWIFETASVIGILDAGLRRPRKRTCVAATKVHAIVIDFEDYAEIMEDNFDFSKNMMMQAAAGLHQLSLNLSPEQVFASPEVENPAGVEVVREGRALNQIERLIVLHNARYFTGAPIQALVVLAKLAKEESWSAGDVLFSPGDPAPEIRIVASGSVTVRREYPRIEAPFRAGGLLSGTAIVGFDVHEYAAVAETDCTTLAILKEDLYDVMEDHFGLGLTMFAFVARENERVRGALVNAGKSPEIAPTTVAPAAAGA